MRLLILLSLLCAPLAHATGDRATVDRAKALDEALDARDRKSSELRWELYRTMKDAVDTRIEPDAAAPAAPATSGVLGDDPLGSALSARFIEGKYKMQPRAQVDAPIAAVNPVKACREELAKVGKRKRKAKVRECQRVAAEWKRVKRVRAQQEQERARVGREREEERRRLELRGRSLTY